MISIRLHHEIYSAEAIDHAAEAFSGVARGVRIDEMPYYSLSIDVLEGADEREVTQELGNYILGLTIDERRGGATR